MIIRSSQHDYYDCMQSLDEDRETQFLRETETITQPDLDIVYDFLQYVPYCRLQPNLIGFCGKLYPVISESDYDGKRKNIIFTIEELDVFVEKTWRKKEFAKYNDLNNKYNSYCIRPKAVKFFTKQYECNDLLEKYPIFLIKPFEWVPDPYNLNQRIDRRVKQCNVVINPRLADYEFFRIVDNFTAYQELCMWFGNKANPEKPIPYIDDKTMAEAKGFNKFSFRKDKEKKK